MAPKWQAKDDYFETCNCRTLCPYISLSPPTEGNCTVLEWHIESGKFGYASLSTAKRRRVVSFGGTHP